MCAGGGSSRSVASTGPRSAGATHPALCRSHRGPLPCPRLHGVTGSPPSVPGSLVTSHGTPSLGLHLCPMGPALHASELPCWAREMIRGDVGHIPCLPSDVRSPGSACVLFAVSDSPWKVHLPSVGPEMTGVTVRGLTPARTYQFRVCAVNRVGKGQYSAETSRCVGRPLGRRQAAAWPGSSRSPGAVGKLSRNEPAALSCSGSGLRGEDQHRPTTPPARRAPHSLPAERPGHTCLRAQPSASARGCASSGVQCPDLP